MKRIWDWIILACLAGSAMSCLLPKERGLPHHRLTRRQGTGNTGIAIGEGDRFANGTIAPRGLGTQPADTDPGLLLNSKEIESAFYALANEYGFDTFDAPHKTHDGNTVLGGRIGGSGRCPEAQHVFINSAIHARERGASDNVLYFVADLLHANRTGGDLTYGNKSYGLDEVARALSAGLVFVPLSNPDGVAWDQATHSCWRKNRYVDPAFPDSPVAVGVDLNRNFDVLWDYGKKFARSIAPGVASDDSRSEIYHGKSAVSEPETKNVLWVMDQHPALRWYLDLHSYEGKVLYSWGLDENQSKDPEMNFANAGYDDVRGVIPDEPAMGLVYSEYLPDVDWKEKKEAANRVSDAMGAATKRHYMAQQSAYLYPTSGASDDYATSRRFINSTLGKVHAFTVEFGFANRMADCPFYPTPDQYRRSILETGAGLMEFLLAAMDIGIGDEVGCPSA